VQEWKSWGDHPLIVGLGLMIGVAGLYFAAFRPDPQQPRESTPPRALSDLGRKLAGVWYEVDKSEQSQSDPAAGQVRPTMAVLARYGLLADGSLSITLT
jgi:hypothetical protein